jgi:hypothetical protein
MKKNILRMSLVLVTAAVLLNACKKDKPGEGNDEEVITTMNLRFTPVGGGATLNYTFDDPDGPGGAAPTKSVIALNPSVTYNVQLTLLNKTVTPVEDITTEVEAEADAHRFYYEPSTSSAITIQNLNNDANGIALGTTSQWRTGTTGLGTIKITLRHYGGNPPNKAANDPVNSPKSDSDIEVTFDTAIL